MTHKPSIGQLRVKNYGDKGTLPIKDKKKCVNCNNIVSGQEKLVNMNDSDKIYSWNLLGLQGALLTYFIVPICMHGIILDDFFNKGNLKCAFVGCIEDKVNNLPNFYKINQPKTIIVKNGEI